MKIPKMILILASLILLLNCSFHNPFLETSLNALFEDEMVFVPGGTFLQTSSNSDGSVEESFTHTISSFYIGKFEVTYELWHEVYIWALDNGYSFGFQGKEGGNQPATYENVGGAPTSRREEPATGINWRDAIVWCNALSQKEGRTPAYYTDSAFTLPLKTSTGVDSYDIDPGEQDNPYVLWSSNGYRLPTEGEWMYAAAYVDGTAWTPHNYAAGASADFNDQAATTQVAWYAPNSDQGSGPQTRVVGTLKVICLEMPGKFCGTGKEITLPVLKQTIEG